MAAELSFFESAALYGVLAISFIAFIYAAMLTKQILGEGMATGKIIEIWKGIKEGANAYLKTQFKSIFIVIGFLGIIIFLSAEFVNVPLSISLGRAGAFLMGSFFSAMVVFSQCIMSTT